MLNVTKFRWVQKRVYINKVFCCVGLFPRKTVIYLFFSAGGGGSSARHVCPAGALSCLPAFLNLVKLSLGCDCLVTWSVSFSVWFPKRRHAVRVTLFMRTHLANYQREPSICLLSKQHASRAFTHTRCSSTYLRSVWCVCLWIISSKLACEAHRGHQRRAWAPLAHSWDEWHDADFKRAKNSINASYKC